jgi:hypothetical protein
LACRSIVAAEERLSSIQSVAERQRAIEEGIARVEQVERER